MINFIEFDACLRDILEETDHSDGSKNKNYCTVHRFITDCNKKALTKARYASK